MKTHDHNRVTYQGREYDAESVLFQMDDPIREHLHESQKHDWQDEQAFLEAYAALHLLAFGEAFTVN